MSGVDVILSFKPLDKRLFLTILPNSLLLLVAFIVAFIASLLVKIYSAYLPYSLASELHG
ncbi:hypothetical protein IKS57_00745 [bacterium]|nr:hypothetical protein [bacterium]